MQVMGRRDLLATLTSSLELIYRERLSQLPQRLSA